MEQDIEEIKKCLMQNAVITIQEQLLIYAVLEKHPIVIDYLNTPDGEYKGMMYYFIQYNNTYILSKCITRASCIYPSRGLATMALLHDNLNAFLVMMQICGIWSTKLPLEGLSNILLMPPTRRGYIYHMLQYVDAPILSYAGCPDDILHILIAHGHCDRQYTTIKHRIDFLLDNNVPEDDIRAYLEIYLPNFIAWWDIVRWFIILIIITIHNNLTIAIYYNNPF